MSKYIEFPDYQHIINGNRTLKFIDCDDLDAPEIVICCDIVWWVEHKDDIDNFLVASKSGKIVGDYMIIFNTIEDKLLFILKYS